MPSLDAHTIQLSIAFPVMEGPESIAHALKCIEAQTIAGAIELLLVTDKPELFARITTEFPRIGSVRILRGTPTISTSACRAQAFREATAPFVANAEDHCHPEPGWAAGMLAAFDDTVAAVCPVLLNGNIGKTIGTADHYANFWFFKLAAPGTNLPDLPGRNCCYRRAVLMALGDRLEEFCEAELNLHTELRAQGWNLRLAPDSVAYHNDICSLGTALRFHFNFGRLLAARRANLEAWSAPRVTVHAVAWPIIPFLKLWRMRAVFAKFRQELLHPDVLGMILVLFATGALGEGVGALTGPGNAAKAIGETEFQHA